MQNAKILYHYTSHAALVDIVTSDSMWLTDVRYLNDSTEFVYTLDILAGFFEERRSYKNHALMLFEMYTRNALSTQAQALMLASLSEKGDLLTQWRAYCSPGKGVALGFDRERFRALLKRQGGWLRKAEYSKSQQHKLIADVLDRAIRRLDSSIPPRPTSPRAVAKWEDHVYSDAGKQALAEPVRRLVDAIVPLASVFKHPSFADEREWRAILPGAASRVRVGASYLVPYSSIPLELRTSQALREVIIGPSPQAALARQSILNYLTAELGYVVDVRTSDVPFRAW